MSLSPDDLLEPTGPIAPSLFPGEDASALSVRLQAYLDDGAARAAVASLSGSPAELAARAWAEYRAFNAVVLRLSAAPSAVSITDQGASSRTVEQLRQIVQARDAALARWNGLVPAPDEVSATAAMPARGTSGSTPIVYAW